MKLYKVEFKFTAQYAEPKSDGMVELTIVVGAKDQFDALTVAWDSVSALNLPEPKSFSASQLGKD
jgi:hypothetical protein